MINRYSLSAVFSCLAAITVIAGASGADAAVSPEMFVLQHRDVPANLVVAVSKTVSNAEITREYPITLRQLSAWGRLTGYRVEFGTLKKPTRASIGPLAIKSTVSICKNSRGAHAYFLNGRNAIPVHNRMLSVRIGDESLMASETEVENGLPLIIYSIGWRHGRYLGGLVVSGIQSHLQLIQVIALARTQESKMAAAGR